MLRIPSARTAAVARAFLALSTLGAPALAQRDGGQPDSLYTREHYSKAEYMVPMRDGVKLYTIVYTPKDTSVAVPIMLLRTPYSIPPYGLTDYKRVLGPSPEFDRDGYIFAFQDARGKFRSEGTFRVMNPYKPVKRSAKASGSFRWGTFMTISGTMPVACGLSLASVSIATFGGFG